MLEFQQNEQTAERRRWIIVLVDSTDGVTGITGQTGQVRISKNGGASFLSTNSLVEVDSTNMPGHYYLELTATELDTLGFISITAKTASTLAFHDRGIVSYNDPYVMAGGPGGGSVGGPAKITVKQIQLIAEHVWKCVLSNDQPAGQVLIQAATHPSLDLSSVEEKISSIDLTPVLAAIDGIEIPEGINYTAQLDRLYDRLDSLRAVQNAGLEKTIDSFKQKLGIVTKDVNGSLDTISKIGSGFIGLKEDMEQFKQSLLEFADMDAKFENIGLAMKEQKQQLHSALSGLLDIKTQRILTEIVESKNDIIDEINPEQL